MPETLPSKEPQAKTVSEASLSDEREFDSKSLKASAASAVVTSYPNPTRGGVAIRHVDKSKVKLFEHPPTQADILQGNIGNCYFYAAISSIIASKNGAKIIQEIIKEDPTTGRVHVKLFDDKGGAHIVSVDKQVRSGATGALWVSLLEKAYTVFALKSNYANLEGRDYFTYASGAAVLEALLGQPGKRHVYLNNVSVEIAVLHFVMNAEKLTSDLQYPSNLDLFQKLFGTLSQMDIKIWKHALEQHDITQKWQQLSEKHSEPHVLRFEDFSAFCAKIPFTNEQGIVLEKIKKQVRDKRILPGKRGTKLYSSTQLEMYEKLDNCLKFDLPVIAGTNDIIHVSRSKTRLFFGRATALGKARGIVGHHAYAVLRCEERHGLKGVVLRNPWGDYGRTYNITRGRDGVNHLSATKQQDGEFWMEFTDFSKRFSSLDYCETYLHLMKRDAMGIIVDRVPGYVLAEDGLFFVSNPQRPIALSDRVIAEDPAILARLWRELGEPISSSRSELCKGLETMELEIIKEISKRSIVQETFREWGVFLHSVKDSAIGLNVLVTPAYVLANDSLYYVACPKVITEKDCITKDAIKIESLWSCFGYSGDYFNKGYQKIDRSNIKMEGDRLELFKKIMEPNQYSYTADSIPESMRRYNHYMKKFDINTTAILVLATAIKDNREQDIRKLFYALNYQQKVGLLNLGIDYASLPHGDLQKLKLPKGDCIALASALNHQELVQYFTREKSWNPFPDSYFKEIAEQQQTLLAAETAAGHQTLPASAAGHPTPPASAAGSLISSDSLVSPAPTLPMSAAGSSPSSASLIGASGGPLAKAEPLSSSLSAPQPPTVKVSLS